MSDEDFEPFVGGPPPDPSERIWRHPSEIAAEARAGDASATVRVRRWSAPMRPAGSAANLLVAGSLGAAACLTAIAIFQGVLSSPPSAIDLAASSGTPAAPLDTAARDTAALETAPFAANPSASQPSTTVVAAVSTTAVPHTVLPPVLPPTALPSMVIDAVDHHLVTVRADTNTVVNGVVLGGYLFTSADAVDHRLSVSYEWQGRWPLAYLVGIDHYSDLAVFRPSGETRAGTVVRALTTELAEIHPADPEPTLVAGDPITIASRTDDGLTTEGGQILAIDSVALTPAGQPLIGLIDTSARQPDRPGALLLDQRGDVAGIVVDTTSSLASALPTDLALAIADRLARQGWANETWIGFMGIDHTDGVEVVDVTADGPADVAGLRPGDIIRFFDGAPIDHMGGITAGLRQATPGDTLVVLVSRNDELVALRVEATTYPTPRLSEPAGG